MREAPSGEWENRSGVVTAVRLPPPTLPLPSECWRFETRTPAKQLLRLIRLFTACSLTRTARSP